MCSTQFFLLPLVRCATGSAPWYVGEGRQANRRRPFGCCLRKLPWWSRLLKSWCNFGHFFSVNSAFPGLSPRNSSWLGKNSITPILDLWAALSLLTAFVSSWNLSMTKTKSKLNGKCCRPIFATERLVTAVMLGGPFDSIHAAVEAKLFRSHSCRRRDGCLRQLRQWGESWGPKKLSWGQWRAESWRKPGTLESQDPTKDNEHQQRSENLQAITETSKTFNNSRDLFSNWWIFEYCWIYLDRIFSLTIFDPFPYIPRRHVVQEERERQRQHVRSLDVLAGGNFRPSGLICKL